MKEASGRRQAARAPAAYSVTVCELPLLFSLSQHPCCSPLSPLSLPPLTGDLRDSIRFQGCISALQADPRAPNNTYTPPGTTSLQFGSAGPRCLCCISHIHACVSYTPVMHTRIGRSKEEKLELGINRASCRRQSQLLCSSLERSWAPAGNSQHPQFQACSRPPCLSHSSIHHRILQIFIRCLGVHAVEGVKAA